MNYNVQTRIRPFGFNGWMTLSSCNNEVQQRTVIGQKKVAYNTRRRKAAGGVCSRVISDQPHLSRSDKRGRGGRKAAGSTLVYKPVTLRLCGGCKNAQFLPECFLRDWWWQSGHCACDCKKRGFIGHPDSISMQI